MCRAVAYIPLTVLAVPASVLTIGGGYLFGLPIGFVADSVGATLGSGAAFLLGRTIGKPFVVAKLKDYPQFQSVALAIEKSGFKICLLLRLAPLLPFSMLNYLLSVTPITLGPYLLSSWLGMMPITLALVYVGTTLKDLSDVTHKWSELSFGHWASLILSLVVSVMLMVCVTKVAQNALRKALAEHGGDMNGAVAASPELNDVANVPADLNEPLLIKIDSQSHQDHENQRVMKEAAG
ncbi:TVP38/TMEM64 family membrane protein slr0305 isoform X2 [Brassica rapa]|uniref:TVP38/TMEM64 family membrane protein slr0305 isoform X2 n=1 Tax=Brassica campestris TaxID=3711 RepID=UPI00142D9C48|nr:TVP38/TMEM64 family membrane protein slr0305 isoform X2 [Brassica rapa]